jgi:hypothetical protein
MKQGLVGLAALVLASGCPKGQENTATVYERNISFPTDCVRVLGAGSSQLYFNTQSAGGGNIDWLSCEDAKGNVVIYRMPSHEDRWYKTVIEREQAGKR